MATHRRLLQPMWCRATVICKQINTDQNPVTNINWKFRQLSRPIQCPHFPRPLIRPPFPAENLWSFNLFFFTSIILNIKSSLSTFEQQITGPSLDMEVMDDLLMSEPRPGNQSSGYSGVGSGRSGSSAGQHPPHPSQQQRVSIGSSYYGAGSRYGDGTTSTVTSSARQSTSYSTQSDNIRVGAGVVVTSHRQSQRRSKYLFRIIHLQME